MSTRIGASPRICWVRSARSLSPRPPRRRLPSPIVNRRQLLPVLAETSSPQLALQAPASSAKPSIDPARLRSLLSTDAEAEQAALRLLKTCDECIWRGEHARDDLGPRFSKNTPRQDNLRRSRQSGDNRLDDGRTSLDDGRTSGDPKGGEAYTSYSRSRIFPTSVEDGESLDRAFGKLLNMLRAFELELSGGVQIRMLTAGFEVLRFRIFLDNKNLIIYQKNGTFLEFPSFCFIRTTLFQIDHKHYHILKRKNQAQDDDDAGHATDRFKTGSPTDRPKTDLATDQFAAATDRAKDRFASATDRAMDHIGATDRARDRMAATDRMADRFQVSKRSEESRAKESLQERRGEDLNINDFIVNVDFTYRRLVFIFQDQRAAVRFQNGLTILFRLGTDFDRPRSRNGLCSVCEDPRPAAANFITSCLFANKPRTVFLPNDPRPTTSDANPAPPQSIYSDHDDQPTNEVPWPSLTSKLSSLDSSPLSPKPRALAHCSSNSTHLSSSSAKSPSDPTPKQSITVEPPLRREIPILPSPLYPYTPIRAPDRLQSRSSPIKEEQSLNGSSPTLENESPTTSQSSPTFSKSPKPLFGSPQSRTPRDIAREARAIDGTWRPISDLSPSSWSTGGEEAPYEQEELAAPYEWQPFIWPVSGHISSAQATSSGTG